MKNYIEEASVTMSTSFHSDKVSHELLKHVLEICIPELRDLDFIKKALFYGKGLTPPLESSEKCIGRSPIQIRGLSPDPYTAINLLHGIIGLATEAGELLEALLLSLNGQEIDVVNISEEVGDIQWYAAAILKAIGSDFETVQRTNIAKLRARFPNKFTEYDANNRNLDIERAILEGGEHF